MNERNRVDLHTHTTASDGALTPEALIDLAIANNTQTLAITDHDTVAGYLSASEHARSRGLQLVTGVELSTTWEGMGIHIIGLNFDAGHPAITQFLVAQSASRQQRAQVILHKLGKIGLPITWEDVQNSAHHGQIGRPHIARAMVEKGYVNRVDKAFKKYLGVGKVGDVKSGWSNVPEAVATIGDSGGVAVVAHPNHYKMTRTKLLRLLDEFIEAGGQGIEVISGKQHPDITEKLAQIANEKGLLASLGSDFHCAFPHAASVGQLPALPANVIPIWQCFR